MATSATNDNDDDDDDNTPFCDLHILRLACCVDVSGSAPV
jgi:hypothetical protein